MLWVDWAGADDSVVRPQPTKVTIPKQQNSFFITATKSPKTVETSELHKNQSYPK
jgi:hypothetical protein